MSKLVEKIKSGDLELDDLNDEALFKVFVEGPSLVSGFPLGAKPKSFVERLCLENGKIIKYVINQTSIMRMNSVRQDGMCLEYCNMQSQALCLEAVKNNKEAIKFVKSSYPSVNKYLGGVQ